MIKDIQAHAKGCFVGILRVPTEHLFDKAIAVTRKFNLLQCIHITWSDHTVLAEVARDLSEKDVARLASSMLEHLYRDLDGEMTFHWKYIYIRIY